MRALSEYLSENKTVTVVDLLNNNLTPLSCEFLGAALHPKSNKTIEKLMMDHNSIRGEGMTSLAAGIAMNPSLQHLSLSYCSLDETAAVPLQLIIAFVETQLQYLNLEGNFLGKKGAYKIMRAMVVNNTIKELNLADNKFEDDNELIPEICKVLEENQTLKQLNLENNRIKEEEAEKILYAVEKTRRTKITLTNRFSVEFSTRFNDVMKSIKGGKKKKGKKKKKGR